jgi:hypothetical protein
MLPILSQEEGLIPYRIGNTWGYCDDEKIVKIDPQFEESTPYSDGRAAVKLHGKWGFINDDGEVEISIRYDEVKPFHDGFAAVKFNGKWGYVNKDGDEIFPPRYDNIWAGEDDNACVQLKGKWGIVDEGVEKMMPKYDYVGTVKDTYTYIIEKDKYGIHFVNGKDFILPVYQEIGSFSSEFIKIKSDKGKIGCVDKEGKEVAAAIYDEVLIINDEEILIEENKKWGMIFDRIRIVEPRYDYIWTFSHDLALCQLNEKFGFINEEGTEIIPTVHDNVYVSPSGYIYAKVNDKMILYNDEGKQVEPYTFDISREYVDGVKPSYNGVLWGYADDDGDYVVQPRYEKAEPFSNDLGKVMYNGKWGYVNKDGVEYWSE